MVVNSLKALLFVAGGTVVAAGAAYVTGALDIFFPERPQLAALPEPQSTGQSTGQPAMAMQPEQGKTGGQQMAALPAGEAPAMTGPSTTGPTTTGKQDRLVVPAFDIVRVEPDGSVVIAGQAAPGAKVEVVTGSSVIGTDKAGDGGDFAVVLDDPLKPGDYTIVLRSTTPDNIVATSEETAIVSVPETQSGQVLALVEKPGAPSRLITVPQAEQAEQAAMPAQSGAGQPATAAQPADKPQEPAGQMAAAAGAAQPPAATAPEQVAGEMAAAQPAAEKPEASADKPAATSAGDAPVAAAAQPEPAAGQPAAGAPSGAQQQVASAAPEQPKPAPAAEKPRISVEAVEIEGDRVFVAGRAEPGARVRVYANEILLGDSRASPGGQFLVEAQRDLPVGDYIVRADLLGPRAEVLARAAVPFEREPGEAISAVAAPEPAEQQSAAHAEGAAPQADAARPQSAGSVVQPQAAAGQMAAADAPSGAGAAKPDEAAGASGATAGQGAAAAQSAQGGQQMAAIPAGESQGAGGSTVASAPADGVAIALAAPEETTAPKLQSVAGAVIIRRGDTLWRISKRVYGRGVRYTTIYLANQGQIEDPDRIWPGQVFSVPDKTGDGEQADMSAVADRVVPVE